jgi:hypothetical protein
MTVSALIISAAASLARAVVGWLVRLLFSKKQRIAAFEMAALAKRLQAHQDAYALWNDMVLALHDPQKEHETAARCQQWWVKNCLYLDSESRKEFLNCAREAGSYTALKDPKNPAETKARFNRILNVFRLLERVEKTKESL